MLELLEQFKAHGQSVELFQTQHGGDDYHVRYGLQVHSYLTLEAARMNFDGCVAHIRQFGE